MYSYLELPILREWPGVSRNEGYGGLLKRQESIRVCVEISGIVVITLNLKDVVMWE